MQVINCNNISVLLRKSSRAKKALLRVTKGRAELVIPKSMSVKFAQSYLKQERNITWLESALARHKEVSFADGAEIKIAGKKYQIIRNFEKKRGVKLIDTKLIVYGESTNTCA